MNKLTQRQKHAGLAAIIGLALLAALAAGWVCLLQPGRPMAAILMYHSIVERGGATDPLVIERKLFARQMKHLAERGYEPVFLSRVIRRHKEGKTIPSNWVVLTFDDGKADFISEVYPVLQAHGFKAVLFVSPGRLETEAEFLTWDQLKAIQSGGLVEIGVHGLYHAPLTCLAPPEAEARIRRSKALLEEQLGTNVTVFAYPHGAFDYSIEEMVKAAGYAGAVGTVYPAGKFITADIYNLQRVFVSPVSGYPLVFRFMLSGYYVPIRGLFLRLLGIDTPRDAAAWKTGVKLAP